MFSRPISAMISQAALRISSRVCAAISARVRLPFLGCVSASGMRNSFTWVVVHSGGRQLAEVPGDSPGEPGSSRLAQGERPGREVAVTEAALLPAHQGLVLVGRDLAGPELEPGWSSGPSSRISLWLTNRLVCYLA